MHMQSSSSLGFHNAMIAADLTEDPGPTMYPGFIDFDTEKCLQDGINDIVEKFGSSIRILCYVACSSIRIWTRCGEKFIHVNMFSCEYLSDRIMDIDWIDGDPDGGRIKI
jgi:hypothetical protein